MKIDINEKEYKVKKRQVDTDSYQLTITPKRRTCFVCKKGFDSNGTETLSWYDDNNYYRINYFCNEHYKLAKRVLTENKRKGLN